MTEAKEKKQTSFENGWVVSYDEVCHFNVIAVNNDVQKLVAQRNKTDL